MPIELESANASSSSKPSPKFCAGMLPPFGTASTLPARTVESARCCTVVELVQQEERHCARSAAQRSAMLLSEQMTRTIEIEAVLLLLLKTGLLGPRPHVTPARD
jgi:hypothetical protein